MDILPENYMQVLDELYLKACSTHKLVAIGEIGLDYHYEGYDKERQIKLFDKQVEYAVKKSLPVIVHCREATQDCLDVLNKYAPSGVVHCFSGSAETAEIVLGLGMYIGFTGALAFKMLKKPDVLLKLSQWTGFFLKRTALTWRPLLTEDRGAKAL